nr:MAG TPA: hypothetical protein [Caudoviricetes sp.]
MLRASPARLCRMRSNDPQLGVENRCRELGFYRTAI